MLIRFATSVLENGTFVTIVFVQLVNGSYVYKSYKHTTEHSNKDRRYIAIGMVMNAVKRSKVPVDEKATLIPRSMVHARIHTEYIKSDIINVEGVALVVQEGGDGEADTRTE